MPYLNHQDILLHPVQSADLPDWADRGKKYYRLAKTLYYEHPETKEVETIPAGYYTDGASIPRWLWTFCGSPFSGNYIEAAIIHDWLYHLAIDKKKPKGTRSEADRIFYIAMLEYGVGKVEAQTKYKAVRMFGPRW